MNAAGLAFALSLFLGRELPPSDADLFRARLHVAQVEIAQLRATVADREARIASLELSVQQAALEADDKAKRPLARVSIFDVLRGGGR